MKSIALTGYMASGKTSTANALKAVLGTEAVDTDAEIERQLGLSIAEIFEKYGEKYFREAEKRVIRELSEKKGIIISTGGGAVLDTENLENLRRNGVIFYIEITEEELLNRIEAARAARPLMKLSSTADILTRYEERKPFYDKYDFKIISDGSKTPSDIAEEIIGLMKR